MHIDSQNRPSFRPSPTQSLLVVIAALLALNLVAQVTNSEPTLATTAAAAQEERGQGLVSAGSQRKVLIAEIRQLSQKIQSIDKRLAGGISVKVTSMPKAPKDKD